ncbi:uncharacterized protein C19orf18 homolog isoform X2 [Mastomys coucha]|uniref:uncharacterized protein C19orf18 homolog isoform X2 n=1 Tax=Mastomys coucha TaxID=35658 RepID=UPI00126299A3|nr:uncharacterized protein C19orf18 homolog isoform X2 [Mastomys coucha]
MHKVWSSSMFLFWFLLGCLLHVCLPYADELNSVEKTKDSSGSRQLETSKTSMGQPRSLLSILPPTEGITPAQDAVNPSETTHMFAAHSTIPRSNSWNEVSSIAFVIALLCGLMISYVIYQLVKAEEKQQLAMLYENVEIPLIDEKEIYEDDGYDVSSQQLPENEDLGKFIGSVIKIKRMENIKKKMKGEQNVLKGTISENSSNTKKVESHEKNGER